MTLDYVISFEPRSTVGSAHSGTPTYGYDRFESNGSRLSYQSNGRNGYCLRVAQDGLVAVRRHWGTAEASQQRCASFYFRLPVGAPSVTSRAFFMTNEANSIQGLRMEVNTSGQITMQTNGGTVRTGPVVSDGNWHRLDYWVDSSGANWTLKWRVDGIAQTDCTVGSQVATDMMIFCFGSSTTTHTLTIDFDDFISGTDGATDFPLPGSYACSFLLPNADGTHNAGTNIMEDQAGNDIGTVTAWDLINEIGPMDAGSAPADYVKQRAIGTGNYAEIDFEDTTETQILAVLGVMCGGAIAGSTKNGTTRVVDSGGNTLVDVFSGGHAGLATRTAARRVPDPGGDGWTQAELNALKMRIGFSSDANPSEGPRWTTLFFEYAFVPSGGAPVTRKLQVVSTPLRW